MEESVLLRIALTTALVGVAVLFAISVLMNPTQATLEQLQHFDEGSDVYVTGVVSRISESEKIAYVDLSYPESKSVVVFKDGKISLDKGDFVEIKGSVTEFKGENQLVANSIDVLE